MACLGGGGGEWGEGHRDNMTKLLTGAQWRLAMSYEGGGVGGTVDAVAACIGWLEAICVGGKDVMVACMVFCVWGGRGGVNR